MTTLERPLGNLRGILVPLLTPLRSDESVDLASLGRLIDYVLGAGAHGLWLFGTSGEFAALPVAERRRAVEFALTHVGGRAPIVVNVGDSGTALAIGHARHAVEMGASLLAVTPPHYYPHTMDEVAAHFRAIKSATPLAQLFAYNIPQAVKVRMTVETVVDLAADGTICGIKDSQNDLQWLRRLITTLRGRGLDDGFRTFAGTRSLIDASVFLGAHGAIPATANIAPAECVATFEHARAGDPVGAAQAQDAVLRYEALAAWARGGSPNAADLSVMKHVLRLRGVIADATVTAPLRPLTRSEVDELADRLRTLDHTAQPHGVAPAPGRRSRPDLEESHAPR